MIPIAALLLMLPVFMTGCSSVDDPAALETLEAIQVDFDAAMEGGIETMEQYTEIINSVKPRYAALAEEYWGTEAAFDARLWTMQMGTMGLEEAESEAVMAEGLDALFTEYRRSESLSLRSITTCRPNGRTGSVRAPRTRQYGQPRSTTWPAMPKPR